MHRTGHWLGMDVHDAGDYKRDGEWLKLKPGMVLTVEPGCYVRPGEGVPEKFWNIGVRIEDDALVTSSGCEIITAAAPKKISSHSVRLSTSSPTRSPRRIPRARNAAATRPARRASSW